MCLPVKKAILDRAVQTNSYPDLLGFYVNVTPQTDGKFLLLLAYVVL